MACADGMSARAAALHFGISRDRVRKMLSFSVPPGYRRQAAINRPKLDGFTEIIDAWHDVIGEPTFADAILDRLVHNAYRIELDGQSMRKTNLKTGDENAQN